MQTNTNFLSITSNPALLQNKNNNSHNIAFSSRTKELGQDVYAKKKSNNARTAIEIAGAGLLATSAVILASVNFKLGKIIKAVGEQPTTGIYKKISHIMDLSTKDSMTGLLSKKPLLSELHTAAVQSLKKGDNYNVAMLDMDNFKGINEIFSHDTGDLVLKRIASNIADVSAKHGAKGFRYGGEEFAVTIPSRNADEAKKIVEEIADAIKKDSVIQEMVPDFLLKSKDKIGFIKPKLNEINAIFDRIKSEPSAQQASEIAKDIIKVIEEHLNKFDVSDTKALDDIVKKLSNASPEELVDLIKIDAKYANGYSLGTEFNKIFTKYTETLNDIYKWTNHLDEHKLFTVSGGIVNVQDAPFITDGSEFLKIADTALSSAKENGKNLIIRANEDIIDKYR